MKDAIRRVDTLLHVPICCSAKKKEKYLDRVAAYCRVSTLSEEQALSYETQREYYTKLIASDPKKKLVGIYGDPGVSGLHTEKRIQFMKMMQDCRDGKIDTVMTKSISRFSRNMSDCINAIQELRRLGIVVIFEKEGINSADANCELYFNILSSIAQEESNSISQAIRWTKEKRAEQGDPTRGACYGYRGKARKPCQPLEWKIYEPEARRIRCAFEMAGRGCCYQRILEELNKMEEKDGSQQVWSQKRLYRTLRNEAYKGDILTCKTYVPDYIKKRAVVNRGEREQFYIEGHHEGIIDPPLFDSVLHKIKRHELRSVPTNKR